MFENPRSDLSQYTSPRRLQELADHARNQGATTKAHQLEELADELNVFAPVILGVVESQRAEETSRTDIIENVEHWDQKYEDIETGEDQHDEARTESIEKIRSELGFPNDSNRMDNSLHYDELQVILSEIRNEP